MAAKPLNRVYFRVEGVEDIRWTRKDKMTEEDGASAAAYPRLPGGDRKLSIPNSVQRRKYSSMDTSYGRVVVVAVDPSECAKSAFYCTYDHYN